MNIISSFLIQGIAVNGFWHFEAF